MIIACMATTASAGETSVFLKSGLFNWEEKIGGNRFVKESGMITGLGLARTQHLSSAELEGLVEVWGGNPDYDGHDVTNTTVIKSDTIYLGTREEMTAKLDVPAGGHFTLAPLAGVGHKFWIRTRSNEDWNLLYGKVGGVLRYAPAATTSFYVKGGTTLPFYTRSHVNLSAAGYEDVVTRPKGRASIFIEAGARYGSWSIGVTYEEMNFGQSDKVATRSTVQTQNGVAVVNSQAFQPESSSSIVGAMIRYHF